MPLLASATWAETLGLEAKNCRAVYVVASAKTWKLLKSTNRSNPLSFAGYTTDGRPAFTYPYLVNQSITTPATPTTPAVLAPGQTLNQTFRDNVGAISSRWQAQVGIRYIFN